jgi:hypothetical protein
LHLFIRVILKSVVQQKLFSLRDKRTKR